MARRDRGECENCNLVFAYELWHAGFGDLTYAYCDTCGMTATLDHWNPEVSKITGLSAGCGEIENSAEQFLLPCQCGGKFRKGSTPRCPYCNKALSADFAAGYLEKNSARGWQWQRSWSGLYCIVIEDPEILDALRRRRDPINRLR